MSHSCSVDGCTNAGTLTRGWCAKHYARWRRHGDPLHVDRPGCDGFYLPAGWVDQVAYDYDTRRPCTEVGRG